MVALAAEEMLSDAAGALGAAGARRVGRARSDIAPADDAGGALLLGRAPAAQNSRPGEREYAPRSTCRSPALQLAWAGIGLAKAP